MYWNIQRGIIKKSVGGVTDMYWNYGHVLEFTKEHNSKLEHCVCKT